MAHTEPTFKLFNVLKQDDTYKLRLLTFDHNLNTIGINFFDNNNNIYLKYNNMQCTQIYKFSGLLQSTFTKITSDHNNVINRMI